MTVSRRLSLFAAVGPAVLALGAIARTATAEPSAADRMAADELFKSARQLATEGRFVEACPKFAQSQRLDPGVGTLLYLGECYEKTARMASAWNAFRQAADQARLQQQPAREKLALDRAALLEPRMPRLIVELDAGADAPGLAVQRDGTDVLRDLFGVALPLDSGSHTVAATAPGRTPWSTSVELVDGVTKRVKIPALVPVSPVASSAPPVVSAPPPPPTMTTAVVPPPPPPVETWPARRSWALAAGGVGLVGLGLGTGFGVSAISHWSDVTNSPSCTARPNCSPSDKDSADRASRAATASTISFTVGLLGLGAGAALWFWPSGDRATALRVGPGSVALEGKW